MKTYLWWMSFVILAIFASGLAVLATAVLIGAFR